MGGQHGGTALGAGAGRCVGACKGPEPAEGAEMAKMAEGAEGRSRQRGRMGRQRRRVAGRRR